MVLSSLGALDLSIDDFHKLRILDFDSSEQSNRLCEECGSFIQDSEQFKVLVDGFIEQASRLSELVEREKARALSTSSRLKSVSQQRDYQMLQLQALIAERRATLDKLRVEHESLARMHEEQDRDAGLFLARE